MHTLCQAIVEDEIVPLDVPRFTWLVSNICQINRIDLLVALLKTADPQSRKGGVSCDSLAVCHHWSSVALAGSTGQPLGAPDENGQPVTIRVSVELGPKSSNRICDSGTFQPVRIFEIESMKGLGPQK